MSLIEDELVLCPGQACVLRARCSISHLYKEEGDMWMLHGPCNMHFTPDIELVEIRNSLCLNDNEGVYIRDIKTGQVRLHFGPCLLQLNEELWAKPLPCEVEKAIERASRGKRDKTSVVTFEVPHSAVTQIYEFTGDKSINHRVVFGPATVCLQPNECFTTVSEVFQVRFHEI